MVRGGAATKGSAATATPLSANVKIHPKWGGFFTFDERVNDETSSV